MFTCQTLPASFTKLSSVEELHLYINNFDRLPLDFGSLSNLKHLIISDNNVISLPTTFENLSKLEHVDISNNKLTFDDEVMAKLNIKKLVMKNMNLLAVPTL